MMCFYRIKTNTDNIIDCKLLKTVRCKIHKNKKRTNGGSMRFLNILSAVYFPEDC